MILVEARVLRGLTCSALRFGPSSIPNRSVSLIVYKRHVEHLEIFLLWVLSFLAMVV